MTSLRTGSRAAVHWLIEIVGQAFFELVEDVVLGSSVNPLVPQRLLGLADVLPGKLGAGEAAAARDALNYVWVDSVTPPSYTIDVDNLD